MNRPSIAVLAAAVSAGFGTQSAAQETPRRVGPQTLDAEVARITQQVVAWRRDIHEHPELGNHETRTAKIVADHLRSLGMEVRSGIAKTGVIGVLRGGKPGPVVALRADMDALPVTEEVDLPFKSTATSTFGGQPVGVMHACGHDAHTAMLLGAADVLVSGKADLPGTVVFIFQPAEEGPPPGEAGGAPLMMAEHALSSPKPDAIFGLHVWPDEVGKITYRPKGAMSAQDVLGIIVHGRQTHGAQAWRGIDPIVVASQIVMGLQTITARQTDITLAPSVVTVGTIHGGIRHNIIPDSVVMTGTIRSFDAEMRKDINMRIRRTAERIAEASGATATVTITPQAELLYNDPVLTARMAPTIERVAGGKVNPSGLWMPSEDFSAFTRDIPGFYFFLGANKPGVTAEQAAPNHSPRFFVNEEVLPVGVKAYVALARDYLAGKSVPGRTP